MCRGFQWPEIPARYGTGRRDKINGLAPQQRVEMRAERSRPLVVALESWLCEQRARVSKNNDTGKAIDYSLKRWAALTHFLDDGRLCMTNNAAERELRAIAVGRRNRTFAGSDEGGRPPSTRLSPPPSSTTSIRRPGSPMS
jgi:transposase